MYRTKTGNKTTQLSQLWLVGSTPEPILAEQLVANSTKRADSSQFPITRLR